MFGKLAQAGLLAAALVLGGAAGSVNPAFAAEVGDVVYVSAVCKDEAIAEQLAIFTKESDLEGFEKLLEKAFLGGECFIFPIPMAGVVTETLAIVGSFQVFKATFGKDWFHGYLFLQQESLIPGSENGNKNWIIGPKQEV